MTLTRFAIALVSRYPRPWRDRYGAEVLELLDASPVRLGDVSELTRGLLTERLRELISADDNPRRTARILSWMPNVFAAIFVCVSMGIGLGLRARIAVPSGADNLGVWAILTVVALTLVGPLARFRQRRESQPGDVYVGLPRLPAVFSLLLPLHFVAIVLVVWAWGFWRTFPGQSEFYQWWTPIISVHVYGAVASRLSSGLWPGRRVLQALGHLEFAEQQLAGAQTWVDGCRTMIDRGVPSPLDEALAQVTRHRAAHEEALGQLRQVGYRARFER